MKTGRILVVDDNKSVLTAIELLLSTQFPEVICISNPEQLPLEIRKKTVNVVLLDMNFKSGQQTGNEGLFWLSEIRKLDPDVSVVMITAYGDIELAVNAIKKGAVDFILKPWDNQKLLATINSALELSFSRRKVKKLTQEKENLKSQLRNPEVHILGASASMQNLFGLIKKVAPTPVDVLITGENGTGKELIAREIHRQSERSGEIFVSVDMGAISETLFESELFGHRKGAFTGADSDRCGKIEAANGGTLFLDEIGNLNLDLQAKLLGALQNRSITRLGDNKAIDINIRLLCATNSDLNKMTEEGDFRMDLLYRINTIQIEAPPLRNRGNDVILLAEYFLDLYCRRYRKKRMHLDPSAEEVLKSWRWPGNVRELQHCIERAVILSETTCLEASDLNLDKRDLTAPVSFDGSLDEMESRLIAHSIEKNGGNLSAVASQLGISRQTLYNKISKYGI